MFTMAVVQMDKEMNVNLLNSLLSRLDRLAKKSLALLVVSVAIESLALAMLVVYAAKYVLKINLDDVPPLTGWWLIAVAVVIAPVFETLIFQATAMWATTKWDLTGWVKWATFVVPFACAHMQNSFVRGIAAGVIGGVYLGACYMVSRGHGSWRFAFSVTTIAHALHNLLAIVLSSIFAL